VVQDREGKEIARILARDEVKRRVGNASVPTVRGFLSKFWQQVLIQAYSEGGEGGQSWTRAIVTMDELLWSIQPKHNAEDRKLLVTLLPSLLTRLRSGIALTSMNEAQKSRFFATLVKCHAAAVKAGLQPTSSAADGAQVKKAVGATAPTHGDVPELHEVAGTDDDGDGDFLVDPKEVAEELARTRLSDGVTEVEEITVRGDADEAATQEQAQALDLASGLSRGAWVEFHDDGGQTFRAKLSWISPHRHLYLFTNISLSKAISISPQALAIKLARGKAKLIEDVPLLDRAVDHMLGALQHSDQ
jgi:hypothetical protein